MKRQIFQVFFLMVLSSAVTILVLNVFMNRKSNQKNSSDVSLNDLKKIIRSEIDVFNRGHRSSKSGRAPKKISGSRSYISPSKKRPSKGNSRRGNTNKEAQHKMKVERHDRQGKGSKLKTDGSTFTDDFPVQTDTNGTIPPSKPRFLVHLCDARQACSGWGDRQRGILSAFLMAAVTGRRFLINMTSPCDMRKFLQPNVYNWDVENVNLTGLSSIVVGGASQTKYHRILNKKNLDEVYPQDVIYLRCSSDLLNAIKGNPHYKNKIPTWAQKGRHQSFKDGWDILMKPTPHIQEHMDEIFKDVDFNKYGDLVCAHVRIGRNPSLPNDSPNRNSINSTKALWEFLDPYVKNASRVFIASDSLDVRKEAKVVFGQKSIDTGGVILHIDRQRKNHSACDGFEMVILEQLMLRQCHILVVSGSNFSIRAAFLRGRKENLFIFKNSKVVPFSMGR